ncbi:YL1 nuclear protein-domain-containing protein [Xylariaceae sp. FL0016]|nr:YL1 nuclear protein-domain-containing protein [Xylariaceae sp. FL0016]
MMATADDDRRTQTNETAEANTMDSNSDSDDSSDSGEDTTPAPVEWLATGREKRSTAGNRMKSMIAAEEPDDELELLFAEDDNDAGFTDVDDDGSDVHMDSSSDDEDAQGNDDELTGEKELEKQAREIRQVARKRKAQEAIPVKFRKKVKIDTSRTGSSTPTAPKPRPKKKSERTSWLPSPADMPTRSSKRETTMMGKEQLHKQMIEREVKRLKQVEAMERKAKRMEALKKPPMTQAERLAEAALVEKRNAKSLNRWEEAEKQREEERKAKLAALNNRTLEGPVVTFWSGVGEWIDGKLRHVGKIVTIEDKPVKKKRGSAIGHDVAGDNSTKEKGDQSEPADISTKVELEKAEPAASLTEEPRSKPKDPLPGEAPEKMIEKETGTAADQSSRVIEAGDDLPQTAVTIAVEEKPQPDQSMPIAPETGASSSTMEQGLRDPTVQTSDAPVPAPPEPVRVSTGMKAPDMEAPDRKLPDVTHPEMKPPDLIPPDLEPPSANIYTTSMFAPPHQSPLMKPPEIKPPPSSFLAPPAGISQGGLSMPMIGYHSSPNSINVSNVLAPPNTAQRQSPLSMPQGHNCPPPVPTPPQPTRPTPSPASAPAPLQKPAHPQTPIPMSRLPPATRPTPKTHSNNVKSTKANAHKHQPKEIAPPPPPPPPANGKATRHGIILQNFNENLIKERTIQTRILFGREMNKLPKQGPAPRCVITNHPARYRDPKTGLHYYNAYAFKEIRKLQRGEYKWSCLVDAWLGSGSVAAQGVPERFLNPNAPGPKKVEKPDDAQKDDPSPGTSESQLTANSTQIVVEPAKAVTPSASTASEPVLTPNVEPALNKTTLPEPDTTSATSVRSEDPDATPTPSVPTADVQVLNPAAKVISPDSTATANGLSPLDKEGAGASSAGVAASTQAREAGVPMEAEAQNPTKPMVGVESTSQ